MQQKAAGGARLQTTLQTNLGAGFEWRPRIWVVQSAGTCFRRPFLATAIVFSVLAIC
jgi:hypothetical protein